MRVEKYLYLAILVCFLFSGAGFAEENIIDAKHIKGKVSKYLASDEDYTLSTGDILEIDVFNDVTYNQKNVTVQPDGKINIFPLNTIVAAGLSIEELKDLLVKEYKFYFNNPRISVKLSKKSSFVVYVTGAVMHPGSYEIDTDDKSYRSTSQEIIITRRKPLLTNILVAAGGISFDADIENITVKNVYKEDRIINVNLLNLIEKGNISEDVYLMPGDSVEVPKLPTPFAVSDKKYARYVGASFSPKKVPVKVYGYVNRPGLVELDASQSVNLNSAITAAGGYLTDSAYAPGKVYISRADASGRLVTKAVNPRKYDPILMPNDIVYVPEKIRPLVGKFFDYMGRVINPFNLFSEGYNRW